MTMGTGSPPITLAAQGHVGGNAVAHRAGGVALVMNQVRAGIRAPMTNA